MSLYTAQSVHSRLINALASIVLFDTIQTVDVRGQTQVALHKNQIVDVDAVKRALKADNLFYGGIVGDILIVYTVLPVNVLFKQDCE